ncbi:MAG: ParA family protein [Streptosporangiaceae bacterium]
MVSQFGDAAELEKVHSKLPGQLHRELKVRAAELGVDIKDAVAAGIGAWLAAGSAGPDTGTAGAEPFSTYLPAGLYDRFKEECGARGVTYIQGLAQSVRLWLDEHPPASLADTGIPRRIIVCNQKGGVGKTAVAGGVAQAWSEADEEYAPAAGRALRVLLVDYDPQGHLSDQLGVPPIEAGQDSLPLHMSGQAKGDIRDLVVELPGERFGGRLHVIPTSMDGFLLDQLLTSRVRAREASLERALDPLEDLYDVIVIDCPPSLGVSVDAAIHYGRQRDGEKPGRSGLLIPVQAEPSSAHAYRLLMGQMGQLCADMRITVGTLGLVVNLYDSRRGYIVTDSLRNWQSLGDPAVLAVIQDLKELREAAHKHQPLLEYLPGSGQAQVMRDLAKALS